MRRAGLALALILALILPMAPPSLAQDDDGEGFLTRLIQDSLSGTGRVVDITGFEGALSSRATLKRMTIADDDGIWLELNDAVLDWTRAALLSGRLEVRELSAASITLTRLPKGEATTKPEASGFSIPDLPVSVTIGAVTAGKVSLGAAVLGEAADFTLSGALSLIDGGAAADIVVTRSDQPGDFLLKGDYNPGAATLALDLQLREPADGLAARMLDLPGLPSVDLSVTGAGPLDDFKAVLALNTDGDDRLNGQVTLTGTSDGGHGFAADLDGDVTALILPQYRDFFGPEVTLHADGVRAADGALTLADFDLRAAALSLAGAGQIDAAGQPHAFALTGRIASPDGAEVLLPFGTGINLRDALIEARFDAAQGDAVSGRFDLAGLDLPGYAAERIALTLDGRITLGRDPAFDAALNFDASGLNADDPALAQAIGAQLTGRTGMTWQAGTPFRLTGLELNGASYGAVLDASLAPGDGTLLIDAKGGLDARDLSAFAALSGTDLSGAAGLELTLAADALGGTFHLTAAGDTTGLSTGIAALDPLLTPPAKLSLDIARSTEALDITQFDLSNAELSLQASGQLASQSGSIGYAARLENAGIFTGGDSGPVTLDGAVEMGAEGLRIHGLGGGRDLKTGMAQADLLLGGEASFRYDVIAGKQVLLRDIRLKTDAVDLSARGDLTAGQRRVDFAAGLNNSALFTGGTAGAIRLSGVAQEGTDGWHVTADGGGRDIGIGSAAVDALFAGETTLALDLRAGEQLLLERLALTTAELDIALNGNLTAGARRVEATGRLANTALFTKGRAGPLDFTASATQAGTAYALQLDAKGQDIGIGNRAVDPLLAGISTVSVRAQLDGGTLTLEEARFDGTAIAAKTSGSLSAALIDLGFDARLDDVARLTTGLSGPLSLSGRVNRADGATSLELQADGPGGIAASIGGQVALPGGAVDLDIKGQAQLALANALIAPQSATGAATFDLRLDGQPGLAALSGPLSLAGGRLVLPELQLIGEALSGTITLAAGRADLALTGSVGGGRLSVSGPLQLSAPYPADLGIQLANTRIERKGLLSTRINADLALNGPVAAGATLSGLIGLSDTEMRIPSGGFGGVEAIPEITHIGEPSASRLTRSRAGLISDGSSSGGGGGTLNLDLLIRTDQSMFIRGRGLDAEMRGELRVLGSSADVRPVGQIDLVRGRLNILTKRLDLVEGRLRMAGAFDPLIRLVAQHQSADYTIDITVEGSASAPEVTFASQPDLPQDEVLAQLFFDRDLSSLSILQAAKLAAAVAELTGSGNEGVAGKIRSAFALDDLDVNQTADGETTLSAGKYITENVYTDVEVTSNGDTSLSINLDVSDSITARGKVTDRGDTGIGLYFQKDY
ncbi:translocation/assembly module TamB domain-containing protein [Pseudooceanicola sp.]|uniref:translocation/assembly module TamB domain-containing protein n=1 Tax=Pseudooceanicola sp. TaxID=1914328 RepID=UPI00261423ED|nr:translocation/assembly module TamB domain-containing protein [Pseudooceanicola sp.]MDF1854641.1 translocation/assembly module TamB domain-containing protein [Pseudooceanicola sp.]